jgi:hypothetical protein
MGYCSIVGRNKTDRISDTIAAKNTRLSDERKFLEEVYLPKVVIRHSWIETRESFDHPEEILHLPDV